MDLSVSLCTHNNADSLRRSLAALRRIEVPPNLTWELVIVDNGSADHTCAVVDEFATCLPLVYVFEPRLGLSVARNRSLAIARGRLLVFMDDDIEVAREWLAAYWQAFERDTTASFYFGGPLENVFAGGPPDAELVGVAMSSVAGLDYGASGVLDPPRPFAGANWACSSQAVARCGGFDESKGLVAGAAVRVGEETALMGALREQGMQPYFVEHARCLHHVPSHKSSFEHVASRIYAHEFALGCAACEAGVPGTTIAGRPLWLYRMVLNAGLGYLNARLRGAGLYAARLAIVRARAHFDAYGDGRH